MRLGFGLALIALAGCRSPQPAVFVDLDAIELGSGAESGLSLPTGFETGLPAQVSTLAGLGPAQLELSATRARLDEARVLLRENRDQALRTLTGALYRAYANEAEAERAAETRKMEEEADKIRDQADAKISERLHELADRRWPLADRLAFLIGFPFTSPANRPVPSNPHDARRHAQAVQLWTELLAHDAAFKADVQRILNEVEAEIGSLRSNLLIDFTRRLNTASDRASSEARAAISANGSDAMGRFAESGDLNVPSAPSRKVQFEALPPLSRPSSAGFPSIVSRTRAELEHDLTIWLGQNGYRRVKDPRMGQDRTREFKTWLNARLAGP